MNTKIMMIRLAGKDLEEIKAGVMVMKMIMIMIMIVIQDVLIQEEDLAV